MATLHIPRISTRHGEDIVAAFESPDDAHAAVVAYCTEWWGDAERESDDPLPLPADPDEIIRTYFELMEEESYEIHVAPLIPTTTP